MSKGRRNEREAVDVPERTMRDPPLTLNATVTVTCSLCASTLLNSLVGWRDAVVGTVSTG